jgi:hypothetical protein
MSYSEREASMGSLCQSKPAVSNTNSTQTYTPAGQAGMQDIYNRVSAAASTPYNPYQGQLVAGLDQVTQNGIGGINANANAAQPYYAQAQNYATAGASDISQDEIAKYNNPYQQNVIDATRANFNETNQQQQSAQRGNAALKGALGGDRVGVAGAELTRQQNLAQNPIIAGMYQQGYDKSLAAAQADRAAKAQGASQFGALGNAAQTSALQGGQAQIGAGQVAQQTEQNKLGANYQQYLNAQAYPYQQAQFLSQYGMPALTGQGGTTTGQQQKTEQAAQASPFSQALGVGLTAAGLFTGNPFMAMGGAGSMFGGGSSGGIGTYANNGSNQNPWMNNSSAGMTWAADGGRINKSDGGSVSPQGAASNPYFASGGFLDTVRSIRSALREHYAEGGVVGRRNFGDGGRTYRDAISGIESSGRYDATGPLLPGGRQAIGRYGIMAENIPQWSRDALGREISREEFAKSPQLQDAIFDHRFGKYVDKYGPAGASKAWFAGEKGMNNPNARDALGTSVSGYESKFNRAMGIPSQDREQLAAMAGGQERPQSASSMLMDKYAPQGEDMSAARKRAIALGLSMVAGGGGSGFADGGAINKNFGGGTSAIERNADFDSRFQPFAPITGGASFNPANAGIPGIPRVQQGFDDMEQGQKPMWQDPQGLPATGQRQDITANPFAPPDVAGPGGWGAQEDPPSSANDTDREQTADGEGPHTDITSRDRTDRQDPYAVYEGNKPQGTSSDDIRYGLMAAGLGILGGKSSNALTNIGEGGLKGLMAYQGSKKQRESAELVARRLMQQSEQFNQNLDLHERQFNRQQGVDNQRAERDERRLDIQEKALGIRSDAMQQRLLDKAEKARADAGKKESAGIDDDTASFLADRVLAGDNKALTNLGRGAQGGENILKIQKLVAQKASANGMDARDILAATAEQSGLSSSQRTFGTQIAKMAVNSTEALGAIKLGYEASDGVPRTNWVPVNEAIQKYQAGTSSPELARFGASNLAIINTYARAISPTGTPTVHDKEEAQKLLSTATGPDAYKAILQQMEKEIAIAHGAPLKAKKELETIRKAPKDSADHAEPPAADGPASVKAAPAGKVRPSWAPTDAVDWTTSGAPKWKDKNGVIHEGSQ